MVLSPGCVVVNGLLAVLPVISRATADICVESILVPESAAGLARDELLIVDNSLEGFCATTYDAPIHRDPDGHNLGVARSWNVGARRVLDEGLDYLVIVSASMRFGPELHTTWRRQMERFWGETVIECEGHSWHLIALHRRCFEEVGLFDPAYYPAYEESIDWGYRMRMRGMEAGWRHCWVNALSQGVALHHEVVSCPNPPLAAYYAEKWGGPKGSETFVQPWGSKPIGYFEEEPIPVLAERYGLGERGVGWW